MSKVRIYDIDGTITKPGNDLWYLFTRTAVQDVAAFDGEICKWKQSLASGKCPFLSSLAMMKVGIGLLPREVSDFSVRTATKSIVCDLISDAVVFRGAVQHIRSSVASGYTVVLATTNYESGGQGFLDALLATGLIDEREHGRIYVSGTIINWTTREIQHFNLQDGKLDGVARVLGMAAPELSQSLDSSYGDDPYGNDSAILASAPKAYVIRNDKNENLLVPKNMSMVTWDDII